MFDTCYPSIKASFVIFSWIKWLSWNGMHLTHHTKVKDDMKFHYYKNFFKLKLLKWLGFATKHPLQLNGWHDMGLTTH
jgi:hypothetical protein